MGKGRLEAFSDGVLAIIITIMVLELKVPHGGEITSLKPLLPVFLSYILSFVYLGIYWNNHHHMLHTVTRMTGGIMWANLHLLFWLSLLPFATGWLGENRESPLPSVLYGLVLLCAGVAYWVLERVIVWSQGESSMLKRAVGADIKGILSILIYALGILLAYSSVIWSNVLYALVACLWIIPDRRIERAVPTEGTAVP